MHGQMDRHTGHMRAKPIASLGGIGLKSWLSMLQKGFRKSTQAVDSRLPVYVGVKKKKR